MQNRKIVSLVSGVALLIAATAGTSAYLTKRTLQPDTVSEKAPPPAEKIVTSKPVHTVQKKCDDGNIAGKAVGGVGGGVVGSLVGRGSGKTAATIAGALGGAYLGGEAIPLNNATCR